MSEDNIFILCSRCEYAGGDYVDVHTVPYRGIGGSPSSVCAIFSSLNRIKKVASHAGYEQKNEEPRFKILESSNLNYRGSSLNPAFLTLNRQYSTPCEMFAKVWSSTLESNQSYTSRSIVTSTRGFLSDIFAILYENCVSKPINTYESRYVIIRFNPIGLKQNDSDQPISASAERDVQQQLVFECDRCGRKDGIAPDQDIMIGALTIFIGYLFAGVVSDMVFGVKSLIDTLNPLGHLF